MRKKFTPNFYLAIKKIKNTWLNPTEDDLVVIWEELEQYRKDYMTQELFEKHAKYKLCLKDYTPMHGYFIKKVQGSDGVGVSDRL